MGKDFRDGFRSYVRTEVPANNRKGRRMVYVYHGQMYHFAMTAHAFRALKAELFVPSLIWAAVQVGVLCLPVPSNGTNLVTIPAFLALAAAAYVVYNALSFLTTKQDAPAWEYHAVNRALSGGTVVAMGLLAVALALHIGSQLFLVRVFVPLELVAMGGYLLCGTLAFWMRRQWRKVQVTSYHTDERAQAAPHKAS